MADESHSNSTVILSGGSAKPKGDAPALHQNALPIGTMLGEFEIIDLVGEGGFGIVYLAQDHSLHRKVALKEYMPASLASRAQDSSVTVRSERQRETFGIGLRSFVNEARILAQFDHIALVKVYRFWEANGTAYMVMPFYSGRTLQDTLRERDKAPEEAWIRKILMPVMDALEIIHEDKCYHRDIAPDNIMLLTDDRPVLLDFGAARRVISDMTQALTVILKPGYAPIEQYAEMPGMKQGPWTDVYALAAVVYFMILNRKPPPAVGRMMQDSYEPLTLSEMAGQYSDRFLQGIDKCLNVKAEDRPQSIAEMRTAIGFGPSTGSTELTRRKDKKNVKHAAPAATKSTGDTEQEATSGSKLPLIGAGIVIAAALAGGYAYYAKQQESSATFVAKSTPAAKPVVPPSKVPAQSAPLSTAASSIAPSPAPTVQQHFATLTEALDGAVVGADTHMGLALEAPKSLTVGNDLMLSANSKSDGFLYVFLWNPNEDRVYRLLPSDKDTDNAVKANTRFTLPSSKSSPTWPFSAREPLGKWRVFSMLSEKPRDFSKTAFNREGDFLVADHKSLDAKLSSTGLTGLFGAPQCAPGQVCPDHYAISSASIAEVALPVSKPAAPQSPPAKKKPDSEREYMKRLNKDLDNLLGK
ncbi:MAG: serine/threonine protein kinase [Rhodocyclales bacterium]|nr:serine/threonine protein kinase [Rhodocyclales bacterium]